MYNGSILYSQPLITTEYEFFNNLNARQQFAMSYPHYYTVDKCRPYFKDSYWKGEELQKKVMERFLAFQKEDQKIIAKNKECYIFYQNKYKEVQAQKQKKKQQQNLKYNQQKMHQGLVKCSMIKYITSSGNPQLYDNATSVKWNSGGFAPAWIELQLPQPLLIQHMRMIISMLPNGPVHYFILFDGKNRIDVNKNLKTGEDQCHWPNIKCSKIRITTNSSPSWIAWTDILVTMEVQWKDIDKIKKYCN